jgi:hypothetical protein
LKTNLFCVKILVNLMRSASSAGETVTKSNQEIHITIPKRAETFNGASTTKDSTMINNIDCKQNFDYFYLF